MRRQLDGDEYVEVKSQHLRCMVKNNHNVLGQETPSGYKLAYQQLDNIQVCTVTHMCIHLLLC